MLLICVIICVLIQQSRVFVQQFFTIIEQLAEIWAQTFVKHTAFSWFLHAIFESILIFGSQQQGFHVSNIIHSFSMLQQKVVGNRHRMCNHVSCVPASLIQVWMQLVGFTVSSQTAHSLSTEMMSARRLVMLAVRFLIYIYDRLMMSARANLVELTRYLHLAWSWAHHSEDAYICQEKPPLRNRKLWKVPLR